MRPMNRKKCYKKAWPRKNLGEVVNFLERIHPEGLNLNTLARELNTTEQAVSYIFNKDDMKLSKAQFIAETYGYHISLFFPEKTYPGGLSAPPPKRIFRNAGELTGLAKYISDSNYSISFVSMRAGKTSQMLMNALTTGDIYISNLYVILEALGITVIWKFIKKINKDE